jgi:ParB family chromosome partitioning protein
MQIIDDDQKKNLRHGLGRGLDSLIPIGDEYKEAEEKDKTQLSVDIIDPNPHQPRKEFNDSALAELAASIREHGVLQPLLVTRENNRYQLVAGERRLRAARIAGLKEVPVIVKSLDELSKLEIAIIENVQREDLNPIEAAVSYKTLIDNFNLTQEEVARKVGKARPTISNTIRLLALPVEIKNALLENKITEGHARTLLNIKDIDKQKRLFDQILNGGITVRQAERHKTNLGSRSKESKSPDLIAAEKKMSESLGTKVFVKNNRNKGQIVIDYYSFEDLERIYKKIISD